MPRRTSSAARHRAAGPTAFRRPVAATGPARHRAERRATTRTVGTAVTVASLAVVAGSAAATGVLPSPTPEAGARAIAVLPADLAGAAAGATASPTADDLRSRGRGEASRSDRRTAVDPRKAALLHDESRSGGQVSRTEQLGGGDPRTIAQVLMPQFGFSSDQFSCLDALWTKESGWDVYADNPTSSAYGIPQALPGSKMATAGPDWVDDAATQIRWGLGYIRDRYGTPCSAWAHSQAVNWY